MLRWSDMAQANAAKYDGAGRKRADATWRKWAMQACGGDQAEAISFIKPEPAPEVSAVTRTTGQDTIDPTTVANDAAEAWRKVWGVRGAIVNVTDKAGMQELMASSVRDGHWKRECSVPPLTAERVRKAMRNGGGKGIGADGWTKEELKLLPDEAAEALLRAYSAIEAEGAFPPQARLTLESLIPKPAKPNERDPGNLRNLGITPVLCRTWAPRGAGSGARAETVARELTRRAAMG